MARESFARMVTFFPLLEDGTYGPAIKLKWCTGLKTKNNYKTAEQRGDGTIEKISNKLETVDIDLTVSSSLPLSIECSLTGADYNKGLKVVRTTSAPVVGALAYEICNDENAPMRRRVLYNTTLQKDERENTTDSEGEELKFAGKAIADEKGNVEAEIDIKEAGADAAMKALWDKFFTAPIEVPDMSAES